MNNVSTAAVKHLLADHHRLYARQFLGDYDAVCALIDLRQAIARANLTERQKEAVALVYGADLTQEDAGLRMGVSKQAVNAHINAALRKVRKEMTEL